MPVKNQRWPPRNLVFFVIYTSDRGDFPRINEIALLVFHFKQKAKYGDENNAKNKQNKISSQYAQVYAMIGN